MINITPPIYNKNDFIIFLRNINITDDIIKKIINLPETITYKGYKYDLYINTTWCDLKKTKYKFELNYYSNEFIEFLFNSKVFNDIDISVNNIIFDLKRNYII